MAGFLDEWRKPSKLLQDVKTKSIERTLLPLIKQVRRFFAPFHIIVCSTLHQKKKKKNNFEKFSFVHVKSKNGKGMKVGRKVKIEVSFCEWDDDGGIILVLCYFKMLSGFSLCCDVCMKGFFILGYVVDLAHSSYHNFFFSLSPPQSDRGKLLRKKNSTIFCSAV